MSKIYYDEALTSFANLVYEFFGRDVLVNNLFLRDAQGKLSFVYQGDGFPKEKIDMFAVKASEKLSPYIDDNYIVVTPDDLFDDDLKNTTDYKLISICFPGFSTNIKLIERRIVGSDWLSTVNNTNDKPAKIVFSSIKGGVGRTTAICVIAAHFSREGKRVLAIDMDLEAPGLGSMLIKQEVMPKFGLLDYFVESSLENVDDGFLIDLVGSSWISDGKGRVDVIPALGSVSLSNPENVLGKISRAYLSESTYSGQSLLMSSIQKLIKYYSDRNRYDLILIDARSGLHETTASLLVGLGANIFFFGVNQPQTISGFELLFSHLSIYNNAHNQWADKLRFIHAKSSSDTDHVFSDLIETKIKKYFYNDVDLPINVDLESLKDTFDVEWDSESEHVINLTDDLDDNIHIVTVANDIRYHDFDPIEEPSVLTLEYYQGAFTSLIKEVNSILSGSKSSEVHFD